MRHYRAALLGRELRRIVEDVGERLVELADIVKKRDTLDAAERSLVEPGRFAEYERIGRDPAHVRAGNRIIGVDCVEESFKRCRAEPLGSRASAVLAIQQSARCRRADCHRYELTHGRALSKNRTESARGFDAPVAGDACSGSLRGSVGVGPARRVLPQEQRNGAARSAAPFLSSFSAELATQDPRLLPTRIAAAHSRAAAGGHRRARHRFGQPRTRGTYRAADSRDLGLRHGIATAYREIWMGGRCGCPRRRRARVARDSRAPL